MPKKILGDLIVKGGNIQIGDDKNIPVLSVNNILPDNDGDIIIPSNIESGIEGKSIFFNDESYIMDNTTKFARIINSDNELISEKEKIVSFSTVFNTWKRFAHGDINNSANQNFPSIPSEVNTWSYNSSTNRISNATNSSAYLGFVSQNAYIDYEFEVQLSSPTNNNSADFITLVLAYTEIDGKQYTLSIIRRPNTRPDDGSEGSNGNLNEYIHRTDKTWSLFYNFMQFQYGDEYVVSDKSNEVSIYNGTFWGAYPNGIKIKVKRSGNIITCSTTNFSGDQNTYVAPIVIDLDSDQRLHKFKNPSSVGYGTLSTAASTYNTIKFTGDQNIIFDSRNGEVWNYNNDSSTWTVDSSLKLYDLLSNGTIYSNPNTNKIFFVSDGNTELVEGIEVGEDYYQVPSMTYFDSQILENGYQKLPNGMIMQWCTIQGTGSTINVTFPIPFSTSVLSTLCTDINNISNTLIREYSVSTTSLTGCTVVGKYISSGNIINSGNYKVKVLIIGY